MHPLSSKFQLSGRCGLQRTRETVRISFVQSNVLARGWGRDGLPER